MFDKKIVFFVSVVENGSFSAAGKKLYMSQSAVSQQVASLEDYLGIKLFDRSGYRPVLTEAGLFYYENCRKIMENYSKTEEEAKRIYAESQKSLNIGILGPLERKYLPDIIVKYKKKYGDIKIDLKKINFETGIEDLKNHFLDISFGILNDFSDHDDIEVVKLFPHRVCVICSQSHPWAKRKYIEGYEIAGQPIITFSKNLGKRFYDDFMESFKLDGVNPNIVKTVNELEEMLLAVKINQGIAFISREIIDENDGICMIDIKHTHHHADFCLAYLKKNDKIFIKDFVNIVSEYFREKTL